MADKINLGELDPYIKKLKNFGIENGQDKVKGYEYESWSDGPNKIKQDRIIKQLNALKKTGPNYKEPSQPTLPFKREEIKPTHILQHIDKINYETAGGPKPKGNDHYHEKFPYVEPFDSQNKSTYPFNQKRELAKVDNWELYKKTAKTPQEIKEIRETVNQSHKKYGKKYLQPDEFKYIDKPAAKADYSNMVMTVDLSLLEKPVRPNTTYQEFLKRVETKPDPDLDKGLGSLLGTKNGH